MGFVNFHIHSEYSFCKSLITIEDIARNSAENGFDGCTVTDTCCTSGFIELSARARKFKLKPVFGCQIIVRGISGRGHYPLILIALDRAGLKNIYSLVSIIGRQDIKGVYNPLPPEEVFSRCGGLAALAGPELYAYRHDRAATNKICDRYKSAFGEKIFLEMNYTGDLPGSQTILEMDEIAGDYEFRPVAASEARYKARDKEKFKELFKTDCDYSLKDAGSIKNIFENHRDYLANTSLLFDMIGDNLIERVFPMPEYNGSLSRLKNICLKRLKTFSSDAKYVDRLSAELKTIGEQGIASSFLLAYELSCFMKKKKIAYGPGSGLFPSSLVLFLAGFTKIDPVIHGLVFELFIPGQRAPMGLELEIAGKRRQFIHNYLISKFGPDHASYLTQVIRPANALAARALARGLADDAGRIVLVRESLEDIAPVYKDENNIIFSGLSGEDIASFSPFFRIDLKAGRQVSIIEDCCRSAGILKIDYDDKETFRMTGRGRTSSIFILENYSIRSYLKASGELSMKVLCDIIALFRKGTIMNGTMECYITRRANNLAYGKASPKAHETNPITWDTYGLILYEEQVFRIAHEAAGLDREKSLAFLHAVVNKDNQAILSFKDEFIRGCIEKGGGGDAEALRLFGILVETGAFAVKKSQVLSYAFTAFSLAYLKNCCPVDFYLASLNNNLSSMDRLNRILIDLIIERPGSILPVDINLSRRNFTKENGKIRPGLMLIKHLGSSAAGEIISERERNGSFRDMLDFAVRTVPLGLHEKALENLVKAGAFNNLQGGFKIKDLLGCVETIFKFASRESRDKSLSLFEKNEFIPDIAFFIKTCREKDVPRMPEFEATDAYLSSHPLDCAAGRIESFSVDYIENAENIGFGTFIVYLFQLKVKNTPAGAEGPAGANALICDKSGMTQVIFSPAVYKRYSSIIKNHTVYLLKGGVKSSKVFADQIYLFDEISEK
ncbi:MAG: PHP domain-containing protein [Brevinematales bacterium]|jgi:DNA polymerase-3 subunit alpha